MTRLTWGAVGQRFYETGVDRGVLYVDGKPGVPWDGLVAINEASSGGEAIPYYIDGVKYLNRSNTEEYAATIEAYTYPEEFGECDGTSAVGNGLFARQQRRRSFSLVYRTLIGNDIDGTDHGYKINIVYDATVSPSAKANSSMSDSSTPGNFSWPVTTKPRLFSRARPTANLVIDSRETPENLMLLVEDILYGNEDQEPRLPSPEEMVYIFTSFNSDGYDAGEVGDPYFNTLDSGRLHEEQTTTIDGGAP